MAKKDTVLAQNKKKPEIGVREFKKSSWDIGGSWKKDWELVEKPKVVAKAKKTEEPIDENQTDLEVETLKEEYKAKFGKNVPNNKVKDIDWIRKKLAE